MGWPRCGVRELTAEEKEADTAGDVLAVVHFVKRLATKLHDKCRRASYYKVAKDANVNPQTLANFIDGLTWGDVAVIYRLERGLNEALWNHDHLTPPLRPRDHLADGQDWPYGELKPDTPLHVRFTKQLAERLQDFYDQETVEWAETSEWMSDQTGCSAPAIVDFLAGDAWADIEFIFRIEHSFDIELWGRDHLTPQRTDTIYDDDYRLRSSEVAAGTGPGD